MSFRFYDPDSDTWSIYWADSRRPGLLDPPVIGSFSGDTGVFEGEDTFGGRPIRVRFTWSGVDDADAAVGAGVLGRRRQDVGDELDHGLHAGSRRQRECTRTHRRACRRTTATWRRSPARSRASRSTKPSSSGTTSGRTTNRCRWRSGRSRDAACGTRRAPARSATLGELGFVVLHRCGESFYFLLVCTWRNENELWETVWAKDGDGRRLLPAVAARGNAPPDLLRVGARRRLSRTAGMDALPLLAARRDGAARLSPGTRMTATSERSSTRSRDTRRPHVGS